LGYFFLILNSSLIVQIQKNADNGNKKINKISILEKLNQTENQYISGISVPAEPTFSAYLFIKLFINLSKVDKLMKVFHKLYKFLVMTLFQSF
jgi:hypothetical protein